MAVLCYNAVVMYITAVPTRTKEGRLSHPSLSLQGRGTLELAPKLLVTDFPHLFVN